MQRSQLLLITAGLVAATVAATCDYATRSDMQAMEARVQALQDSVGQLRGLTKRTFMTLIAIDTVPIPPCPPRCQQLMTDLRTVAATWGGH